MDKNLSELRQILSNPTAKHISDEMLAEIVTAEVSGEDVALLFKAEMAHIENCVVCAEAYSQLFVLMEQTLQDMSAAAEQVLPQDIYANLLLQKLGMVTLTSEEKEEIRQWVAQLPLLFAQFPAEISPTWQLNLSERLFTVLKQIIPAQLTTLTLYLRRVAEQNWGRVLEVAVYQITGKQQVQFSPGQISAISTLSGYKPGIKWELFNRRIGSPIPLLVQIQAEQSSELACEVTVRVDRPGLIDVSGRPVQLFYGSQRIETLTNSEGVASFAEVPISALSTLQCDIG